MNIKHILRICFVSFLAFCVLSSKHILIYNEETLVALSFACFVVFVAVYFGDTITDAFQERSHLIQEELQHALHIKETSYHTVLAEHQNIAGLVANIHSIVESTLSGIGESLSQIEHTLQNACLERLVAKFHAAALDTGSVAFNYQQGVSHASLNDALVRDRLPLFQPKTPLPNVPVVSTYARDLVGESLVRA